MDTPRRRPQFSLAVLVLVCLLIGAAVLLALSYQKQRTLQAENVRLRDKLGELNIDDAAKIYVRKVDLLEYLTWRWWIHAPPGKYKFCYALDGISKDGFPAQFEQFEFQGEGREVRLDVCIRKNEISNWQIDFKQ